MTSPFAYEDQNMTSGDESDNEDLTDGGDSIDSDWSDLGMKRIFHNPAIVTCLILRC